MGPDLSVVLDHLQSGVAEMRALLAAPGPLTPTEREGAVEHVRAASAALTNLRAVLHRANRRSQEETGHALGVPLRYSCECRCISCERLGAGYFAQLDALQGEPDASTRLSTSVFSVLTAQTGDIHE